MRLMAGASALGRLAGLGTQWVVGLMFTQADFIQFAAVLGAQTLVAGLRDAGVGKYLVQKGHYDKEAYPATVFAWIANLMAVAGMLLLTPLLSRGETPGELIILLLPYLLMLPLQSVTTVFQARLRIEQNFKPIAIIETCAPICQGVVTAGFACCGAGVYSLAAGGTAGVLLQYFAYRRYATDSVKVRSVRLHELAGIFSACKWIMISGAAIALAMRGDLLLAGYSDHLEWVAYYTFGTQLVFSILTIFSSSLQTVILPAFSRLQQRPAELSAEFDRISVGLARRTVPALFAAVAVTPLATHLLWQGKWDGAIFVIQFLLLAYALKLPAAVSGVLLEATGQWRVRFFTLLLEAILMMAAAALFLTDSSFVAIVLVAALARITSGLAQIAWASLATGVSCGIFARALIREGAVYAAPLLALTFVAHTFSESSLLLPASASAGGVVLIAAIFAWRNGLPAKLGTWPKGQPAKIAPAAMTQKTA